MGLVRAFTSAVSGVIGDQWKEFFYCDALPSDVLVKRAFKKTGGIFNNFGSDNIITNGSGIAVADGQCMMIVEDGEIVEEGDSDKIFNNPSSEYTKNLLDSSYLFN